MVKGQARSLSALAQPANAFASRYTLPSLPVPPLTQTLALFQKTIEPLLNPDELQAASKLISE